MSGYRVGRELEMEVDVPEKTAGEVAKVILGFLVLCNMELMSSLVE